MPAEDGKRLMHADITINGGTVLLCDEFPEYGGPPAPSKAQPAPVAVTIPVQKPAGVARPLAVRLPAPERAPVWLQAVVLALYAAAPIAASWVLAWKLGAE